MRGTALAVLGADFSALFYFLERNGRRVGQ
jgi:hypothetical protein